jgi:hypothetical protein
MSRIDDFETGMSRTEADRLFREEAARRVEADGRLVKWFGDAEANAQAERAGRLLTTAFAVFAIVGGLAMTVGVALLPASALSAVAFVVLAVVARLF